MSYQVIARKYRPQRFSDVVGQEHVTQTLSNAIHQKRIAHAYLFVGPRGTGKTTIARIFAKCLNCTDGPKVDFSDDDPRCQEITEGRALDVMEIDGASNRGIEEVRELRETVKYAPATSRFKIYIIDEVHMLTKEAFNALLKTLEEPPAHVKFMFATTEPEKILPTILSRCQRFDLRRIPVALIVGHLASIAKLEKVDIEEAALHAIARGADGGMRDAESALDQLISFCGLKIVEADVLSMFGLTAQGQIMSLACAILKGQAEVVLREMNELSRHGKDLARLLSDLLNLFRNLLVFKLSHGDLKLLEVSEMESSCLAEQAPLVDEGALTRIMEVLSDSEGRLRDAASKKIFLEVALLKAIQARNAVNVDTLLQHLTQLKNGSSPGSGVSTATPTPAPRPKAAVGRSDGRTVGQSDGQTVRQVAAQTVEPSPAPDAAPLPAAVAATAATAAPETSLADLWRNLLEAVGRASAFTRSYLIEAHPVSLTKNVLTIGFDPEFADQVELVNNQRTHALLQTKLQELGHPQTQIKFIQAESLLPRAAAAPAVPAPSVPAPSAPPEPEGRVSGVEGFRPAPVHASTPGKPGAAPIATARNAPPTALNAEEFKNDPLIKTALEIFKGQIVDIRT